MANEETKIELNKKPLTKVEKVFMWCIIGGLSLALFIIIIINPIKEFNQYDDFAKCLTEEGVKMYGMEMCPHCTNQKEMFGFSFINIDYVDCDKEDCSGLSGVPTWEINGTKHTGEMSIERLAELSGCEV